MAKKESSHDGLVGTMLSDSRWRALIPLCCSLSMAANQSPSSPFLRHHSADSAVFAFSASWSADDWILPGARSHFGEADVDAALFPSVKSVGNDAAAAVNGAFLRSFKNLLEISQLSTEVSYF